METDSKDHAQATDAHLHSKRHGAPTVGCAWAACGRIVDTMNSLLFNLATTQQELTQFTSQHRTRGGAVNNTHKLTHARKDRQK